MKPNEDDLDDEDGTENSNALDFITETNSKELQLERERITENAAPKDFGFEKYWKLLDGTFLDKELVPIITKEGWKPKKQMKNESAFEDLPNPGHRSEFVYRPYPWTSPYQYH